MGRQFSPQKQKPTKLVRPQSIIAKKIPQDQQKRPQVFYQIRWNSIQTDSDNGEKWVEIQCLKYFLEMIERFEIANFDGPDAQEEAHKIMPVDEKIQADQIFIDIQQIIYKVEVEAQNIKKQRDKKNIDFIYDPIPSAPKTKNTIQTLNFALQHKYRHKIVKNDVVQGSFSHKDRIDTVLNYVIVPRNNKYNFLCTWKPRQDGSRPKSSWVEQDNLKENQPELMRQLIREKNLDLNIVSEIKYY